MDASFVSSGEGKLESVPDSRSAIFKSRSLLGPEKYQLMNFFKHVQGIFANGSEEDLDIPFGEFLTKRGLSQKLKSYTSIPQLSLYFSSFTDRFSVYGQVFEIIWCTCFLIVYVYFDCSDYRQN